MVLWRAASLLVALGLGGATWSGPGADCSDLSALGAPRPAATGGLVSKGLLLCKTTQDGATSLFQVRYDLTHGGPSWVAYRLSRAKMRAAADSGLARGGRTFRADPALSAAGYDSPRHDDYRGLMQIDRGHLAPAEAMKWHPEAFAASFLVTNVTPQNAGLNRGPWRRLETAVRAWACDLETLTVITGALYRPMPLGWIDRGADPALAIPNQLYKALYSPMGGGRMIAFLYPNEPVVDLAAGALSVDDLERMSGLDFFPELAAERQAVLESAQPDLAAWPLRRDPKVACGLPSPGA